MRFFAPCLLFLAVWTTSDTHAAEYTLPAAIGTSPFANCSLSSGTTYSCSGNVTIGSNDTLVFSSNITLQISGNFSLGNNSVIYGNGNSLISTGGSLSLGNNAVAAVNFTAGGAFSAGNNAKVSGTVTATGSISLGNNTVVNGTCNKTPTGGGHLRKPHSCSCRIPV